MHRRSESNVANMWFWQTIERSNECLSNALNAPLRVHRLRKTRKSKLVYNHIKPTLDTFIDFACLGFVYFCFCRFTFAATKPIEFRLKNARANRIHNPNQLCDSLASRSYGSCVAAKRFPTNVKIGSGRTCKIKLICAAEVSLSHSNLRIPQFLACFFRAHSKQITSNAMWWAGKHVDKNRIAVTCRICSKLSLALAITLHYMLHRCPAYQRHHRCLRCFLRRLPFVAVRRCKLASARRNYMEEKERTNCTRTTQMKTLR